MFKIEHIDSHILLRANVGALIDELVNIEFSLEAERKYEELVSKTPDEVVNVIRNGMTLQPIFAHLYEGVRIFAAEFEKITQEDNLSFEYYLLDWVNAQNGTQAAVEDNILELYNGEYEYPQDEAGNILSEPYLFADVQRKTYTCGLGQAQGYLTTLLKNGWLMFNRYEGVVTAPERPENWNSLTESAKQEVYKKLWEDFRKG